MSITLSHSPFLSNSPSLSLSHSLSLSLSLSFFYFFFFQNGTRPDSSFSSDTTANIGMFQLPLYAGTCNENTVLTFIRVKMIRAFMSDFLLNFLFVIIIFFFFPAIIPKFLIFQTFSFRIYIIFF